MVNPADVAALLPHEGAMCLLSEVLFHDKKSIVCRAESHRFPNNPLRCEDRLPALAGIEYAAQAIAAHCTLVERNARKERPHGLLAGARAVMLRVSRLDDIQEALTVQAERLVADGPRFLYAFAIKVGMRELLSGRIAVVLKEVSA